MLSVWLPLNGDLRNQGLSNITATNNGATVDNNGKIGKCYSFDGNDDFISISCSDLYNTFSGGSQPFSIAFWVYHADTTRAIIFGDFGLSGAIGFNVELTTSHQVRFYWNGTPDKVFNVNASVGINTWTHIIITYDGNEICIYKNGVQQSDKYSGTLEAKSKTSGMFYLGRDYRTGTTALNGKINDFRIYDHCLSPRECKQISTALVLHYPLSMPGQENLQQGSDCIGSANVPGWVNNGKTTLEKIGDVIHFKRTLSNEKHVPTITMNCVTPCEFNKSYVYSMDLKFDRDIITTASKPAHFWCGARNTDNIFNTNCNGNLSKRSSTVLSPPVSTIIPANTWFTQKYRFTFGDGPTSEGYDYPAIRCFVYGGVLTENYTGEVNGWMKNCKIEEGEIATPWLPNPADAIYSALGFDDGIEYDVSGYGHNGTKVGTITYDADTPRYETSTHISATDQYIKVENLYTSGFGNSYTFSWWSKVSTFSNMQWGFSNGVRLNGMYTGKLWNTGDSSNNPLYIPNTTTQVTVPTTSVWHHWVMTGDGTTCRVYQDGELWGIAKTYKSISGTTLCINGWNDTTSYKNSYMIISDFRIYATCLSPQDVRDLYAVGASVADNGTLMASEVSEL